MGGAGGMPVNAVGQPGNLIDRFVARFIDGVIVGVVGVVLNIVLAFVSDSWLLTGFISAVATAALYLGYFAYFESTRGQTIGKQVMKLRVFGPGHVGNPTLEQAARRNIFMAFGIAGVVPIIGSVLGGLAGLAAVILIVVNINSDPQRQHWFDKFAGGTQVLKVG
ncbi:RDD family protein [Amorphoplanes digitatis]|uniref:Putative RDD family membrane protein YckC n=1 Tax=Actinoplanes digitatis TaxID=1868 RepID=A0A7W7I1X3_9ACTN|nr:RDD family protein [Actinoplanes digitatis]MBB4764951.1 putative RDD family membrane protein YckC [Actinoplanes digitatis]